MATEEKMICLILVAVEKHSEGKKEGRFEEIEVEVVKYVTDMRRNGFPVT